MGSLDAGHELHEEGRFGKWAGPYAKKLLDEMGRQTVVRWVIRTPDDFVGIYARCIATEMLAEEKDEKNRRIGAERYRLGTVIVGKGMEQVLFVEIRKLVSAEAENVQRVEKRFEKELA